MHFKTARGCYALGVCYSKAHPALYHSLTLTVNEEGDSSLRSASKEDSIYCSHPGDNYRPHCHLLEDSGKLPFILEKSLGKRAQERKVTCNKFSQQDYNLRLIFKSSFSQSIQDAESPPRSSFCSVEAETDGQSARKCLELWFKSEIQSMC